MVKFTGGNLDESERWALTWRLARETAALRMARQGVQLAQDKRNLTLRTMKAAGFTLAELSGLSGLKTAMLSRITSAKREGLVTELPELIEDPDGAPLPAELQRGGEVWRAVRRGLETAEAWTPAFRDLRSDEIAQHLAPVLWPWLPSNDHSPAAEVRRQEKRNQLDRSIAGALQRTVDPMACPKHPDGCCNCPPTSEALQAAAELLERVAIGDGPEVGAHTIELLVGHARGARFPYAPEIAEQAMLGSAGESRRRVQQAIVTLGIELPV